MVKKRKKRKTRKQRRNSNQVQFHEEEKNTSQKMNPVLKILSIVFFAGYVLLGVGSYGVWAFVGAFVLWVIFYLLFAEFTEYRRKL